MFVLLKSNAQNLVLNPSFEDTISCPFGVYSDSSVAFWRNPTISTPDYYNACSDNNNNGVPDNQWGYQNSKTGNAYAGFVTYSFSLENYREYWEVKLSSPLDAGTTYYWSFWISRLDEIKYASNNIGIVFSTISVQTYSYDNLNIIPDGNHTTVINDYLNWVEIKGEYNASGGEEYLLIGNFFYDTQTTIVQNQQYNNAMDCAYYYLDDVCISADYSTCHSTLGIDEITKSENSPIKIIDAFGRESEDIPNSILIYIYSDGKTEKVYRFE